MDVRVVRPDRLGAEGAEMVAGWLRAAHGRSPQPTFLAAMGTSPLGVYAGLAAMSRAGVLDPSGIRLVQLDEYVGVGDHDRRSLFGWLRRDVATPLGIGAERTLRLVGEAPDPDAEAGRHDAALLDAGGLDVSVLGLGPNGHLGFNEPPSGAHAPTRVVELAAESVTSNARYWGSTADVPRRAMTVGMDRLLGARRTLLVVRGTAKAGVLRRLLTEPVNDAFPASHLRGIGGVTLLADDAAWPANVPVPATLDA